VWWVDVGQMDTVKLKAVPVEASLRAFVWYAHIVMYDAKAQENGICFCETLGKKLGFWGMMTLFPMKLSVKLDRLTIGVLPVKMKQLLVFESPAWMMMLMKLFGVFMSKKMKERMKLYKAEWQVIDEVLGADKASIPVGFGDCGGTMTMTSDPVTKPYYAAVEVQ
jgi:hypothetical protein